MKNKNTKKETYKKIGVGAAVVVVLTSTPSATRSTRKSRMA